MGGPRSDPVNDHPLSSILIGYELIKGLIKAALVKHFTSPRIHAPQSNTFQHERSCVPNHIVARERIADSVGANENDVNHFNFSKTFKTQNQCLS